MCEGARAHTKLHRTYKACMRVCVNIKDQSCVCVCVFVCVCVCVGGDVITC